MIKVKIQHLRNLRIAMNLARVLDRKQNFLVIINISVGWETWKLAASSVVYVRNQKFKANLKGYYF